MAKTRSVSYFDVTGKTLVHPISYKIQEFQKAIVSSAVSKNTLISLPPGLGMSYLASLLVLNFYRWFLNSKIIVLSQNKNYINELMTAYQSYTTLPEWSFGNTSSKEVNTLWNRAIILTSPTKLLDSINNNVCSVGNLILLVVYESNKIIKCREYKELMNLFNALGFEYRVVVFVDGYGFNAKNVKQIIDIFDISKLEIRKLCSPDIKECTYSTQIESIALDISSHMISIKDAFYTVYEKYGKLLKDAKVVNGNIASFTKTQLQKAKEKLIKMPPPNMNKQTQQELLDSMTMCSFLCTGIEILHNWGVRSFYNYLFDQNKDDELKILITQDEHLKSQMKLLNEYLKSNGKKIESLMSRIIHPKLLYLKKLIIKYFPKDDSPEEEIKIVVFCSMEEIIDDIDRLFSSLSEDIRHQCVKTKVKSLANTDEYKEVVQNFNAGVINILIISALVEEINELKADLIISLEPNKVLLKFSDPRFHKGAEKCYFILTKGNEYTKFETMLHEKQNEQKTIDIPEVQLILKTSPFLFPQDFNPEFESTSVTAFRQCSKTVSQNTMMNYVVKSKSRKSSVLNESDAADQSVFANDYRDNVCASNTVKDSEGSTISLPDQLDALNRISDSYYGEKTLNNIEYDSFDELLSNFPEDVKPKDEKKQSNDNFSDKENEFVLSDNELDSKFKKSDVNHNSFENSVTDAKSCEAEYNKKMCNKLINFIQETKRAAEKCNVNMNDSKTTEVTKFVLPDTNTDIFEEINTTAFQREMLNNFSINKDTTLKNSSSKNTTSETPTNGNVSPILSASKKSKKTSKIDFSSLKNSSSSIYFDSSFEVDDNFSQVNLPNGTENVDPNPPKVDDWDPDCVLFEDDDVFDDIAANLVTPQKENVINTSTPLVSKSVVNDCNSESDSSRSVICATADQSPVMRLKINSDNSCRKKAISNSFFSNFASKLRERYQERALKSEEGNDSGDEFPWMQNPNPTEKVKLIVNDEKEEYPWLKKPSSSTIRMEANVTPEFKKPSPYIQWRSRSVTPGTPMNSSSNEKSTMSDNTPEMRKQRKLKNKNKNLKRNLAAQFIDNEAEVSSDEDNDTEDSSNITEDDCDSFIDDDPVSKRPNYSNYLKSIKSPQNAHGKFKIPVLSESKLRVNVYSQMDYCDQTYQHDSFCVEDVDVETDSEYVPSILTQMENQLQRKKKDKNICKRIVNNISPGNDSLVQPKKKKRKRIMYYSSSDSDDD